MASLQELGRIELSFEGTSYFLVEGETGQDLLWMEGGLSLEYLESGQLVLGLSGQYSTPWPERQPVTGGQWTNPEGLEVTVPGVETQASWHVGEACSSIQAMSDGWKYDILNCEVGKDENFWPIIYFSILLSLFTLTLSLQVVLGQDLVLLTLYLGSSPQGSRDLVGGVTHRMGFHSWIDMQAKGYLVNRWQLTVELGMEKRKLIIAIAVLPFRSSFESCFDSRFYSCFVYLFGFCFDSHFDTHLYSV